MPDVASPRLWAREVAGKIHAFEAANSDESVEQRSSDLEAMVRKSLAGVPATMKNAYLDELDTHFPAAPAAASPVSTAPDNAANESAAAVIRRRLSELSPAERGELLRQLLNVVFHESRSDTRLARLLLEGPRKSSAAALTPPPIDPERLLRVFEVFCESILGLQRLAIELWREVGARKLTGAPALASDADFRASIARSLAGDADVPPAMIEQEIERQRRAIATAMAMLGPFAENYALAVLKPLAPESISASTTSDSFSMFGSREAGYWKQFCRTWESLGDEYCQSVLVECLAKHLRTMSRSNP